MSQVIEQRCAACGTRNRIPATRRGDDPRCARCKSSLLPREPVAATDANFAELVEGSALPVLVDFWAPWCGPCRAMEPILQTLASQRAGDIKVAKVNVDENPQLARRFGVKSIPAMKLLRGSTVVGELTGAVPSATLTRFLQQHGV